jgi:hypothetical protein
LSNEAGQAVVEFTLVFVLFLIVALIPADFGLAIFTGQLAQNASREGARIAAADPNLPNLTGSCNLPCSKVAGTPLQETAERLSSALLPGAKITLTYPIPGGVACNQHLRVDVEGDYNFFFYQILNLMGGSEMRWEHQKTCGWSLKNAFFSLNGVDATESYETVTGIT